MPESGSDGSSGSNGLWRIGDAQVGGSAPEDRLLVKMADVRGVSGRRNGKLPPWPEQATSRWAACWRGWLKLVVCLDAGEAGYRRGRKVSEVGNQPVDHLRAIRRQGCRRPEICSGFAVMASPKVARAGRKPEGGVDAARHRCVVPVTCPTKLSAVIAGVLSRQVPETWPVFLLGRTGRHPRHRHCADPARGRAFSPCRFPH